MRDLSYAITSFDQPLIAHGDMVLKVYPNALFEVFAGNLTQNSLNLQGSNAGFCYSTSLTFNWFYY